MKLKAFGIPLKFVLVDGIIVVCSFYLSLLFRLESIQILEYFAASTMYLPFIVITQIVVFYFSGSYKAIWRYFTAKDTVLLAKSIFLTSLILMSFSFLASSVHKSEMLSMFLPLKVLPRSTFLIYAFVATILLLSSRLIVRFYYEHASQSSVKKKNRIPTIIYGAGKSGQFIARRYIFEPNSLYKVVGYIDDKKVYHGRTISGVKILGGVSDLDFLIKEHGIQQFIISISSISSSQLNELVFSLGKYNIKPKIVNSDSLFDLENSTSVIRDINIEDLLFRQPKDLDLEAISEMLRGKSVLVTGAGGSIGSELAKQINNFSPERLILLDHSEYALYKIDSALRDTNNTHQIIPALLDLKDKKSLELMLELYQPEVVFHAAAYKHVHLVEANPYSAIMNNIGGTKNLIDSCLKIGVKDFVLISTDKAVNPVGVMGATKRICELLVTAASVMSQNNYTSVRFGNVLGSSGSLIPKLQEQIKASSPITITHPEMTRYFMLISEAVSLVLQSATLSKPGDINILKMGKPVKILDLAKSLITLSGKELNEVPILYTGLRPGEKMFEELYIRGDELQTDHPDLLTLPMGDTSRHWSKEELLYLYDVIDLILSSAFEKQPQAIVSMRELIKHVSNIENVISIDKNKEKEAFLI